MLGQLGTGERLADAVIADVRDLDQAVEQAERLENAGIDADADVGVAGSDSLQRRADVKALSATTAIGSRRRASWMSAPSLRSGPRTAAGGNRRRRRISASGARRASGPARESQTVRLLKMDI